MHYLSSATTAKGLTSTPCLLCRWIHGSQEDRSPPRRQTQTEPWALKLPRRGHIYHSFTRYSDKFFSARGSSSLISDLDPVGSPPTPVNPRYGFVLAMSPKINLWIRHCIVSKLQLQFEFWAIQVLVDWNDQNQLYSIIRRIGLLYDLNLTCIQRKTASCVQVPIPYRWEIGVGTWKLELA